MWFAKIYWQLLAVKMAYFEAPFFPCLTKTKF